MRRCVLGILPTFLMVLAPVLGRSPPANARAYTLPELIDIARKGNPGLAASAQATARIEAQLSEANRSWMPSGELVSLIAPAPDIRCEPVNADKAERERNCVATNISEVTTKFRGVFSRTELRLVQPLFTFGKISAGRQAAEQGVAASKNREAGVMADVELNVRKAYYGLKLARTVLETLNEGMGYLDDAQKQVDEEIEKGTSSVTQTDRLRLRTVRAELD